MYNPREGKLRRNKYLNLGYEDTPAWEDKKLLADCIEAYIDMSFQPEERTAEKAISILKSNLSVFVCEFRNLPEMFGSESPEKERLSRLAARLELFPVSRLKEETALLLRLINEGSLMVEPRVKKERRI